uniref:Secreted luciferase n=1 Tax=Pleuromamma scutullata TaxID=503035 RepID=U3TIM6_9MAXI|nr:secreted luciferase [Pleuromamma scutullata]
MSIQFLYALVCLAAAGCQSQKLLPSEDPEQYNIADLDDLVAKLSITDDEMETYTIWEELLIISQDFANNLNVVDGDRDRKLPGKKLPLEVLKIMEANARRAGCTRGCLICLSKIKCTAKMKKFIPGRCHTYEGDKSIGQGGIGAAIIDIPEIPGFKELEPMEQFIAQVDLCADCTTRCLKGLANVRCNDLLKKWLPDRCAGFANKIQSEVHNIKGLAGDR